jgi:hypothetical protein
MADIEHIIAEIVILTTRIRLRNGLGTLMVDAKLATAAQGHAKSMARGPGLARYAHQVDGKGPDARVTDAGYRWSMVSENIAWSKGHELEKLAECFVDGWWNSPHHRENMLEPRVEDIGVGLARATGNEWFGVQNFGLKAAVIGLEYASLRRLAEQGKRIGQNVLRRLGHETITGDLRDHIYYCHHCGQPHEYDSERIKASNGRPGQCTACGQDLRLPYRIRIGKQAIVLLNHDTKLYRSHLQPDVSCNGSQPIAEMSQHPRNPSVLGLRNLSAETWVMTTSDGSHRDIPPGRSARLANGIVIDFGGVRGEIRL